MLLKLLGDILWFVGARGYPPKTYFSSLKLSGALRSGLVIKVRLVLKSSGNFFSNKHKNGRSTADLHFLAILRLNLEVKMGHSVNLLPKAFGTILDCFVSLDFIYMIVQRVWGGGHFYLLP